MDIEKPDELLNYLRHTQRLNADEHPAMRVLQGGVSNRAVWVSRASGEQWVLKQALPKLRVAVDWFSPPERIAREALGMRWLGTLLPDGAVPELLFEDPSEYLLCMTAVPEPHRNWKTMLLAGELEPDHVRQFASLLGAMHRGGVHRAPEAEAAFGDTSFFESLRLEPYYAYTATRVPDAEPFLNALIRDTRATRLSIAHGDYSPKNILVHNDRLVLLDHEVIHFGDPAFDLGFSLTHLLSKARHVEGMREAFISASHQYWKAYLETVSDRDWRERIEERAVRHTLGCLLARVDGRSPLEYLTNEERTAQRTAVLGLINDTPAALPELIDRLHSSMGSAK